MSHVSFQVNLEDEEGILQVWEMLGCYLNGSKVKAAKERYGIKDTYPPYGTKTDSEQGDEGLSDDTPPPPPVEEPAVELDSAGEPWDAEKHSANRSKLKDGTWRPRRNSKAKDEKPVPPPPGNDAAMAPEEIGYKQMMEVLKGKAMTLPEMNELAKAVGVDSIGLLISQPELIPAVLALAEDK